jgi:N-acetylglucosamine malate deacetylase 1
MKLQLLVIAAHPDDAELSCGGTIISHTDQGYKAGIVDLTQGELGTRGTPEIRKKEALRAAEILGVSIRENLQLADGFFAVNQAHLIMVIEKIRQYKPDIVITNPLQDRHPDHERAGRLVKEACFLSGLSKVESYIDGKSQKPWRPHALYHFIQHTQHSPDFIVDITGYLDKKMEAIWAFQSQFYDPASDEPDTLLSEKSFLEKIKSRSLQYGAEIFCSAGEGFLINRTPGVKRLTDLV